MVSQFIPRLTDSIFNGKLLIIERTLLGFSLGGPLFKSRLVTSGYSLTNQSFFYALILKSAIKPLFILSTADKDFFRTTKYHYIMIFYTSGIY